MNDDQYITCGYDPDAEQLGFESSIKMSGKSDYIRLVQYFPTIVGEQYTVSWYQKCTTGGGGMRVADNNLNPYYTGSFGVTQGYEFQSYTFTATSSVSSIRPIANANSEVFYTGIMAHRGATPFAHTFARGEVYNTNINFDMNGIKVIQLDANGNRVGFTMISPEEFAGYYDTDGNGTMEKIFYLNKDAVVSKRSVAEQEIIMGKLKFINLDDNNYCGWALVPSTVNDWQLSQGADQ